MGRQNLINPYVPIFSRMLASNTLPAVGASRVGGRQPCVKREHGHLDRERNRKGQKYPDLERETVAFEHRLGMLKVPFTR